MLRTFADDEAWLCTAVVKKATRTEAFLKIMSVGEFLETGEALFSDDKYMVVFEGGKFGIRRKSDNQSMSNWHTTEALAIRAIRD